MYSFGIFSLSSLLVANAYLFLAIFIIFKDPKNTVNRFFALLNLSMCIWAFGEGMERASIMYDTAYFWATVVVGIGSSLEPVLFLHFWLIFSKQADKFKKIMPIFVIYIPGIIFLVLRIFFPRLLVSGLTLEYWGYATEGTKLFMADILYVVIYTFICLLLILKIINSSLGKFKKQAQYIGWGISLPLLVAMITQATRPLFHFPIPELTITSSVFFVILVTYAINKYQLMGISTKLIAENIISTMEDYVIAINKQMKVVFVNNSALQSIGYKEEELINKPVSLILAADVFKLSYDQALKKFPLRDYHAEIILKNKDKISVSVNASVLKEGLSDVAGFVFDLRDMRPTEELIKGLEQNKKDLEASKNELIVSQKELERKNEEFEKTNEKFKQINNLMVGRELKMTELKEEIEKLKEKLNQA